jgi:chloramphenicol 3-O-phosphotransferase
MAGSLVVLTGASRAGKTAIARRVEAKGLRNLQVLFFDSVGVPSRQEMIEQYGTGHQPGGAWMRATTIQWMKRIRSVLDAGACVLFEGQMRIAFIQEALTTAQIGRAHLILVDCAVDDRTRRLTVDRGRPDLASIEMLNWARYLRNESLRNGIQILDTSSITLTESVERVVHLLMFSAQPPSLVRCSAVLGATGVRHARVRTDALTGHVAYQPRRYPVIRLIRSRQ